MDTDVMTTRSPATHRSVEPARLRMTWALERGPGPATVLVARWGTGDARQAAVEPLDRGQAA